jgi:hypothetical protein
LPVESVLEIHLLKVTIPFRMRSFNSCNEVLSGFYWLKFG